MPQLPMFRDLRLVPGGTMPADVQFPLSWVVGAECIRQRIVVKLSTFLGEPLFDAEAGVPWFSWLGPKQNRPAASAMAVVLGRQIQEIPGVSSCVVSAIENRRSIAFSVAAVLLDGTRATFQIGPSAGGGVPGSLNSMGWSVLLLGWTPATA